LTDASRWKFNSVMAGGFISAVALPDGPVLSNGLPNERLLGNAGIRRAGRQQRSSGLSYTRL
jgi:hypothetical protein